jgi:polysaccharide export outer membrane protein
MTGIEKPKTLIFPLSKGGKVSRRLLTWFSILTCSATIGSVANFAQDPKIPSPSPSQQSQQIAGSGGDDAANPDHPITLQHRNPRYQVRPSDVIELNFPFTPEFNQTVSVQPDGYISLRGVEAIRVGGKSLPEVTSAIQSAYATIMRDPVVSIELKDYEKPYFLVGGQVGHPGKFDLRGETTATEAVTIAGGLTEASKHSEVMLFHRVPDGWIQVKKLNMKKMLHDGKLDEDAYIQPGDFVYVPKNTMSKIARFIPTSALGLYASPMH